MPGRLSAVLVLTLLSASIAACGPGVQEATLEPSTSDCPTSVAGNQPWIADETGASRPAPVLLPLPQDLPIPVRRHQDRPDGRAANDADVRVYEQALAQLRQRPFRVVERGIELPTLDVSVTDQDFAAGLLRRSVVRCPGVAEVALLVIGDRDLDPIRGSTDDEQAAHPPEVWVANEHADTGGELLGRLDPLLACTTRCQLDVIGDTPGTAAYLLSESEPIADIMRVEVFLAGGRVTAFRSWSDAGTGDASGKAETSALVVDLPADAALHPPAPQTVVTSAQLEARKLALPGSREVTTEAPSEPPTEPCLPAPTGFWYCSSDSLAPARPPSTAAPSATSSSSA